MITQLQRTQKQAGQGQQQGQQPVTLNDLKAFLQIDYNEENALLQDILDRAIASYEAMTGRFLTESEINLIIVGPHNRYLPGNNIDRESITATNATFTDIIVKVDKGLIATVEYDAGGFEDADIQCVIEIAATMYQSKMTTQSVINQFVKQSFNHRILRSVF